MQIEAILAASWRVHARCLEGTVDYTRSKAKRHYVAELASDVKPRLLKQGGVQLPTVKKWRSSLSPTQS